jgi:quinohemoprotein ethanol dehydrogenase
LSSGPDWCFATPFIVGVSDTPSRSARAAKDAARIAGADQDPANWMTYGRTYGEQRFSPLSKTTADNVGQLGLAWFADLETSRGQEATPLVIDRLDATRCVRLRTSRAA